MSRLDTVGLALARRLPLAAALRAGDFEGRLAQRLGRRGPSTSAVRSAFSLTHTEARRVAMAQSASSTRTRNLRSRSLEGLTRVRPLVDLVGWEHLRNGAAIVVVAPWGPMLAAITGVTDLRGDAIFVADIAERQATRWDMRIWSPGRDAKHAAATLKRAVDHLRDGGVVVLALVGRPGQATVDVPFFGGTLAAPRGIAAMARQARVPVVPLTTAWRPGPRPLTVSLHTPLELDQQITDAQTAGRDLVSRLVAMFETVARAAPSEGDRRLMSAIRQAGAAAIPSSPPS